MKVESLIAYHSSHSLPWSEPYNPSQRSCWFRRVALPRWRTGFSCCGREDLAASNIRLGGSTVPQGRTGKRDHVPAGRPGWRASSSSQRRRPHRRDQGGVNARGLWAHRGGREGRNRNCIWNEWFRKATAELQQDWSSAVTAGGGRGIATCSGALIRPIPVRSGHSHCANPKSGPTAWEIAKKRRAVYF